MKLGFLTAAMPERSLEQIAEWGSAEGYEALEVACWPSIGDRPFTASHIHADAFDAAEKERVEGIFAETGMTLSALAYYDNNLHPDPAEREAIHDHLIKVIDAAAELGVPRVGTFIGRNPQKSVLDDLAEAEGIFPRFVQHAEDKGVKLMIENRVMAGRHPDGYPGNLAYSPKLREWMFEMGLYLNFDPSHVLWAGVDPVSALKPYVERVINAHAEDAGTFQDKLNRYGCWRRVQDRESEWDMGWWRYRIPALGDVDWRRYVDTLYEGGFEGARSVEHEDPVWGGSPELADAGLEIAYNNLRPLVVH